MSTTSSTSNDWDNAYAKLARVASQLNTSGSSQVTDNASRQKQISSFRDGLEDLNQKLNQMEELSRQASAFGSNMSSRNHFTPAECSRRRNLVNGLGKKYDEIFSNTGYAGSSTMNSSHSANSNYGTSGLTQRTSALAQQDAMIDELALGVGRLKDQSKIIGDEAKYHVSIMNDMENDMAVAQSGFEDETNHAARLKESQSVWRLYMIIFALSLLMLLLILAGIS